MDIIQAWKKAKEEESISRGIGNLFKGKDESLLSFIGRYACSNDMLLSDDWEVERKPLVWEGEVDSWNISENGNGVIFPFGVNTFELKKFIGKRTKIRIEEIL